MMDPIAKLEQRQVKEELLLRLRSEQEDSQRLNGKALVCVDAKHQSGQDSSFNS